MPPEIILKKSYTSNCGIWNLGITVIEMAKKAPIDFKKSYSLNLGSNGQTNDFIRRALQIKEDKPTAQKLFNVVI